MTKPMTTEEHSTETILTKKERAKPTTCCRYQKVGKLEKYRRIIGKFWRQLNAVYNVEGDKYNCNDDIDLSSVKAIQALKMLDKWKSNIFILFIHYGRSQQKLAKELNTTPNAIGRMVCVIRKEIKENICRL